MPQAPRPNQHGHYYSWSTIEPISPSRRQLSRPLVDRIQKQRALLNELFEQMMEAASVTSAFLYC